MDEKLLEDAQTRLGLRFNDLSLLETALSPLAPGNATDLNEEFLQLEVLGNNVLRMLISVALYRGDLVGLRLTTLAHNALDRKTVRAAAGEALGLLEFQNISSRQRRTWESRGEKGRVSRATDMLEALLAAVYEDQGAEAVESFFFRDVYPLMREQLDGEVGFDPRGRLNEIVWGLYGEHCCYKVVYQSTRFPSERHVELSVAGELWETGSGTDRKSMLAAAMATKVLKERFGVTNDAEAKAKIAEIKFGDAQA